MGGGQCFLFRFVFCGGVFICNLTSDEMSDAMMMVVRICRITSPGFLTCFNVIVFNATFYNISVISWFIVEDRRRKRRTSHKSLTNFLYSVVPSTSSKEPSTLVMICTACIGTKSVVVNPTIIRQRRTLALFLLRIIPHDMK